jgi:hypothetical protein
MAILYHKHSDPTDVADRRVRTHFTRVDRLGMGRQRAGASGLAIQSPCAAARPALCERTVRMAN